jgi:hypothetical protein
MAIEDCVKNEDSNLNLQTLELREHAFVIKKIFSYKMQF